MASRKRPSRNLEEMLSNAPPAVQRLVALVVLYEVLEIIRGITEDINSDVEEGEYRG